MKNDLHRTIKLMIAAVLIVLAVTVLACRDRAAKDPNANSTTNANTAQPSGTPAAATGDQIIGAADAPILKSNNAFDHNREEHKKQQCILCHKRAKEDPKTSEPVFPGHEACDRCHTEMLTPSTSSQSKLCVACHTLPIETMPNTKFINFKDQLRQFGLRGPSRQGQLKGFSHKDHLDPAKMPAGTTVATCETCHTVEGRGINASMPSHPQCYSCHTHQKDQKLGSCDVCHTDTAIAMKYDRSVGAAYTSYNFKHGSHTPGVIRQGCDKCHGLVESPVAENRSDILQISTARGQRHGSSCWSCHSQRKETVCSKCHLGGPPSISF
jgi:hypothetical protein